MIDQRSGATAWRGLRKVKLFWSVVLLFTIYISIVLLHHEPPSLTDYSDWTYEGVLLSNHLKHIPDPAHILKSYPVPNSISTLGIAALSLFLPWQMASKLWIVLMLVAFLLVSTYVMRTHSGTPALWLISPASIFLNINLWYGFANFQIGLCLTLLLSAVLLNGARKEWVVGLLLVLTFFAHMIPFAIGALLLVLFALQNRRYTLLWQLLPGALLSLCYLGGRFFLAQDADGSAGMVGSVKDYSALFWAFKVNSYLKSLGFANPETSNGSAAFSLFGRSAFVFLLVVNLILGAALLVCLMSTAFRAYQEKRSERFVWTTALIALPVFVLAPGTMLGISDPGARVLQAMLAITLFHLSTYRTWQTSLLWVAAGCEVILQSCGIVMFAAIPFNRLEAVHNAARLPHMALTFAHVPNHAEDYFYRALAIDNMSLRIYPTAMFLNSPEATSDPNQCAGSAAPCLP